MLPLSSAATTCRDCDETGENATARTAAGWCIRMIDLLRSRMSYRADESNYRKGPRKMRKMEKRLLTHIRMSPSADPVMQ